MTDKQTLRRQARAWRAALDPQILSSAVSAACTLLLAEPRWEQARTVALYAALPHEPDLTPLVDAAHRADKRVALPVVTRRAAPLTWREHVPGGALQRGGFGVPIPPPSAPIVPPETVDLVVVPALLVDAKGYRIGYGGGYYDRSLPTLERAWRVWLGLPGQLRAQVPRDDFDVPVHALLTPDGLRDIAP